MTTETEAAPAPVIETPTTSTTESPSTEAPPASSSPTDPAAPEPTIVAAATEEAPADETVVDLFGAPEADYEIEVLGEDGKPIPLDADALAVAAELGKKFNLSNAGLAEFASTYATKLLPLVSSQIEAAQAEAVQGVRTQWANDVGTMLTEDAALPEAERTFGGGKMADVTPTVARAMDKLFGDEFRTFLNDTGLGNHPQMVRAMYLVGRSMKEDSFTPTNPGSTAPKSREEKYYGSN